LRSHELVCRTEVRVWSSGEDSMCAGNEKDKNGDGSITSMHLQNNILSLSFILGF
jgi:hypothetical protein